MTLLTIIIIIMMDTSTEINSNLPGISGVLSKVSNQGFVLAIGPSL